MALASCKHGAQDAEGDNAFLHRRCIFYSLLLIEIAKIGNLTKKLLGFYC